MTLDQLEVFERHAEPQQRVVVGLVERYKSTLNRELVQQDFDRTQQNMIVARQYDDASNFFAELRRNEAGRTQVREFKFQNFVTRKLM